MLRRNFLRLLAALPALPFVARAKAEPTGTTSYEYRIVPLAGSRDAKTGAKICPVCGSIMPRGGAWCLGGTSMRYDADGEIIVEQMQNWCDCAEVVKSGSITLIDAGAPVHCLVYDGTKWVDVALAAQRPRVYLTNSRGSG